MRDAIEKWREQAPIIQSGTAVRDQSLGALSCALDPKKSRIRAFAEGDIASGRLAENVRCRGHVEHVVSDLEGESDRVTVSAEDGKCR